MVAGNIILPRGRQVIPKPTYTTFHPSLVRSESNEADINQVVPSVNSVDYRQPRQVTSWPSSQDLLVSLYPENESEIRSVAKDVAPKRVLLYKISKAKRTGALGSYYYRLLELKALDFKKFNQLTYHISNVPHSSTDEIDLILRSNTVHSLLTPLYRASLSSYSFISKLISDYLKRGTTFKDVPEGSTALDYAKTLIHQRRLRVFDPVWENALWSLNYFGN